MILSSDKDTYGFEKWEQLVKEGKTVHVFLDGVEVVQCVTADEDGGYVVRCVLDVDGNVQIDPDNTDQILRETVGGNVMIVVSDDPA